jgi:hypothetical protein
MRSTIMSRILASTLVVLLAIGVTPAKGVGQATMRDGSDDRTRALMTPGAHLRIKLPGQHVWTSTLVALVDDSMLVRNASGTDTTLVRLTELSQLQVSAGVRRSGHVVRNSAIGVILGSGLGWMVGRSKTTGGCEIGDPCFDDLACLLCLISASTPVPPVRDHAMAGTVVGGLVGGAVGLLVSQLRREDWRPVSVSPRRTAFMLSPGGGRVAIRF